METPPSTYSSSKPYSVHLPDCNKPETFSGRAPSFTAFARNFNYKTATAKDDMLLLDAKATMMPVTVNVNLFATHMPNTSPALTYAACYNTSWILRSLCLFYYCKSEMNFAIITLCLDLLFIDVTPRNPLFCKDYASILLKFMFSDVWPNTKKVGDKPLLSVSIFVQVIGFC
ncbi:hypothetical protein F2Q68_00024961 [Brassica cretica]|uniref:Uncharacterized protein n=1 Tax=Brassica cretica TaxID=69181 RepID=A0A8S9IAY0_BRACR|nr:hypothetical protein F2Q68_00024961 [Brassica cretica]